MLIKLHRWLGLVLSLSILSISITGVLLLWKQEYLWLTIAQARQELKSDSESLARSIEQIVGSYSANQVLSIQVHSNQLALHKVFLSGQRYAWHDQHGAKIEEWQGNERLEDFLLDLHHRFLLGNTIGLNMVGFSGLLAVPLVVLGLSIWWPRRRTFRAGLLPQEWRRTSIIRSHGNLGVVSLLAILLTAITGAILVYPDESRQLLLTPFVEAAEYQQLEEVLDNLNGDSKTSWLSALTRSRALYADAEVRWVSPPSSSYPYRAVGLQQQQGWNPTGQTMVYINAESGNMAGNTDALQQPAMHRLFNFSYPLHTGALGLWYRLLLSIFGVAIMLVSLFALSSYLKR